MKAVITIIVLLLLLWGGYVAFTNPPEEIDNGTGAGTTETEEVSITPISHATFVLAWGEIVIYNDPVGGADAFAGQPVADLVLVSDTHGDHLNVETLTAVLGDETLFIAPQAVVDELPAELAGRAIVLANGETTDVLGISIEALPMYNLPDQGVEIRHEKGRGNGYLLENGGTRVYIAGDTADIPEMRALEDIAIAFVPMNMPYTMTVEDAAGGVLAFAPATVYPYHYRGMDGLSDVNEFKRIVNAGNPDIDVVLHGGWYPAE